MGSLVKGRWIFGLVLAILVGASIWVVPAGLARFFQFRAGQLLAAGGGDTGIESSPWLASPTSPAERDRASQAVLDLQQSLTYAPRDEQSYLLLGLAYMRASQPGQAAGAFRTYVQMRPKNPLGHVELASAYEEQCREHNLAASSDCAEAITEWQAGGLGPADLIPLGDRAFDELRWADALTWYERSRWWAAQARLSQELPPGTLFKEVIAAGLAGSPDLEALLAELRKRDGSIQVITVHDTLEIDGAEFRWLTRVGSQIMPGSPLAQVGDSPAGFMWWGGRAVALMSVEQDGDFSITVRVQQAAPPPVEMAVGVDGKQVQHVTLARGDSSWETITFPARLPSGFHTVEIWYLNDAIVNGRDRNAAVESAEISRRLSP